MMRALVMAMLLGACGRLGFDAGSGNDAGATSGRWLDVAVGASWTCAIANDHSLWCWGAMPRTFASRLAPPTQIAGSWTAVAISSSYIGGDHGCAIATDNTLWCWGANEYGQVGNGTMTDNADPVQIGTANWTSVAAGAQFTCGIQSDRSLWCWGFDNNGALGDGVGGSSMQLAPVQLAGAWRAVTTGATYACAIRDPDALYCWGNNSLGTIGDDTSTERDVPTRVPGAWRAVAASSSDDHTCAIATDGSAWCWGDDGWGQLGDGLTSNSLSPLPTRLQLATIAVGDNFSCGTDAAGQVTCWGDGRYGQLGALAAAPAPTGLGIAASRLAIAGAQTCVISAGALSCTGRNALGQLASAPGEAHVPVRSDTRTDWTAIVAGGTHACGVTSGGATWCWGINDEGEVGDGTLLDRQLPVAGGGGGLASLVAGPRTTIGVAANGSAWLWGCDYAGNSNNPTPEQLAMTGWGREAVGYEHTCGMLGSTIYCRGDNTYGQLGDGTTTASSNTLVPGSWSAVAAGTNTTCAIATAGGAVSCWGDGDSGEIGNGGTIAVSSPTSTGLMGATTVAVGSEFACAIVGTVAGGSLYCWGSNSCGQLGSGGSADASAPSQVGVRTDWVELALGDRHACAIAADHTLWCWGHSAEGAVGSVDMSDPNVPTQVGADANWLHVAAGVSFTCALRTDGTRWCFGADDDGQLGNGLAWRGGFVAIP
jgi:alpha-tubulin suppressor-like RCC1 family protein